MPRGRCAGAGDHRGAHAVHVDRGAGQRRRWRTRPGRRTATIRVLVAPSESSSSRASRASTARSPESIRTAPSSGPGDLDRGPDALGDVVRVDQQRGVRAERVHLGPERGRLVVVQQRERVRGGAGGRHAVSAAGLEVGGGGEPGQVGGPGRGHRRLLVGTPGAHLDQRPVARGGHHPGRGRGDRAVVVEDRQRQRLQQHRLAERAGHGQHRRVRGTRARPPGSRRRRR